MAYTLLFLLKKMWVAFAFAKATYIFFNKNTCELDIALTRTVNILTTKLWSLLSWGCFEQLNPAVSSVPGWYKVFTILW